MALLLFAGTSGLQLLAKALRGKGWDRPLFAETVIGGAAATAIFLLGENAPPHGTELVFALLLTATFLAPALLGPAALQRTLAALRPALAGNPAVSAALRRLFIEGALVCASAGVILLGGGALLPPDDFAPIASWILPGALAAWLLLRLLLARLRRPDEVFPIVDETGRVIGRAPRRLLHRRPDLLHPVVHLHIVDSAGRLLLQRRSRHKDSHPGCWDVSVGGHIRHGESVEAALRREAGEETGRAPGSVRLLFTAVYRSATEAELAYVYLTAADGPFFPADGEADELRFFTASGIRSLLATAPCTPCLHAEFPRILDMGALSG